jgi:hypothetical protein
MGRRTKNKGNTKSGPSDNQLKVWLNSNCAQGNNWITLYKFDDIAGHSDTSCFVTHSGGYKPSEEKFTLTRDQLKHIYFTYMTDEVLITLIENVDGQLYLIHNNVSIQEEESDEEEEQPQEEQSHTVELTEDDINNGFKSGTELKKTDTIPDLPEISSVESKIIKVSHIKDIVKCLTTKEQRSIGMRGWFKCKLKKVQRDLLDGVSYLDFISISSDENYIKVLDKYIKQSGDTLNLINNYSITTDHLENIGVQEGVQQLVLHQNFQINSFEWLKNFPNMKLLNFWYCHQIEMAQIEQICQMLPDLEVINIHACCRMNLRVLIPILKLKKLQKLAIDDIQFWCQKGIHELFVLPDEWKNLYCPTLTKVAINSKNLTLDVIDYILQSCPKIEQFLIDEDILKMVGRNSIGGYEDGEIITFHSWQNPNKGMQIHKDVTFKNMFKDTYNSQMFSDSMMRKIKERYEQEKAEIEVEELDKMTEKAVGSPDDGDEQSSGSGEYETESDENSGEVVAEEVA